MLSVKAIIQKELRSYFNTPIAYIVAVFFLVFTSAWLFFMEQFYAANTASLRGYFGVFPMVFIFLLPALTMRSWAEEARMKTDEILLTLPIRVGELVVGKFFCRPYSGGDAFDVDGSVTPYFNAFGRFRRRTDLGPVYRFAAFSWCRNLHWSLCLVFHQQSD